MVDKFDRLVAAGSITAEEAVRRRRQSLLDKKSEAPRAVGAVRRRAPKPIGHHAFWEPRVPTDLDDSFILHVAPSDLPTQMAGFRSVVLEHASVFVMSPLGFEASSGRLAVGFVSNSPAIVKRTYANIAGLAGAHKIRGPVDSYTVTLQPRQGDPRVLVKDGKIMKSPPLLDSFYIVCAAEYKAGVVERYSVGVKFRFSCTGDGLSKSVTTIL